MFISTADRIVIHAEPMSAASGVRAANLRNEIAPASSSRSMPEQSPGVSPLSGGLLSPSGLTARSSPHITPKSPPRSHTSTRA
ncbi:MAG: hypothetical protein ACK462_09525, partial [Planctomyces sp.]